VQLCALLVEDDKQLKLVPVWGIGTKLNIRSESYSTMPATMDLSGAVLEVSTNLTTHTWIFYLCATVHVCSVVKLYFHLRCVILIKFVIFNC
jgi:hypothetical protein